MKRWIGVDSESGAKAFCRRPIHEGLVQLEPVGVCRLPHWTESATLDPNRIGESYAVSSVNGCFVGIQRESQGSKMKIDWIIADVNREVVSQTPVSAQGKKAGAALKPLWAVSAEASEKSVSGTSCG